MNLDDTYYLKRAGRYSSPKNTNDHLPDVYGDLTDGSSGNWQLPCIDTTAFVYCFAGHEVLSVANGNSIAIYADGVLVSGAEYTFDESNDYESEGAIATVTFASDQGNALISARGMGKDDGAGRLLENIIDIVSDFLTVSNNFTSAEFESTAKALARDSFEGASYKAAGVIASDVKYFDVLQQMMGSFLGSVFFDGQGLLVLNIDTGQVFEGREPIPRAEVDNVSATQRLDNLINHCPCNYAYNYLDRGFARHTDQSSAVSISSQAIFGDRQPKTPYQFYWCRDLASVLAVQAIIVAKFSYPVWEISFEDITLKRLHVENNAPLVVTLEDLYDRNGQKYINQVLRVISVRPDFKRSRVEFRCLDTGNYLLASFLADGLVVANGSEMAGGGRDMTIY